jgi:hypothetical protein
LRVWAAPIKSSDITIYQAQTATLFACLHRVKKTGGSLLEKNLLIYCLLNGFLVAIAFLKANDVAFKPPDSKLFGYRQIA